MCSMMQELRKEKRIYDEKFELRKGQNSHENMEYAGRILPSIEQANQIIRNLLTEDEPCMIGRFGGNELKVTVSGLYEKYPIYNPVSRWKKEKDFRGFFDSAGFFPKKINEIPKFAELMKESCKQVDLLGVWFNKYEDMIIERFAPQTQICPLRAIEPYYSMENPWTDALEGKKVLVIHPFAETILSQYEKRNKLFENPRLLPDMELKVLKSVQTIGRMRDARFETWFEALDYMLEESRKIDFDIAIIGCGAYGFPLAAKVKQDNKKVIHMGGATQILFGIKGKRWDKHEIISEFYNENWVRPLAKDTPTNLSIIEDQGCYW